MRKSFKSRTPSKLAKQPDVVDEIAQGQSIHMFLTRTSYDWVPLFKAKPRSIVRRFKAVEKGRLKKPSRLKNQKNNVNPPSANLPQTPLAKLQIAIDKKDEALAIELIKKFRPHSKESAEAVLQMVLKSKNAKYYIPLIDSFYIPPKIDSKTWRKLFHDLPAQFKDPNMDLGSLRKFVCIAFSLTYVVNMVGENAFCNPVWIKDNPEFAEDFINTKMITRLTPSNIAKLIIAFPKHAAEIWDIVETQFDEDKDEKEDPSYCESTKHRFYWCAMIIAYVGDHSNLREVPNFKGYLAARLSELDPQTISGIIKVYPELTVIAAIYLSQYLNKAPGKIDPSVLLKNPKIKKLYDQVMKFANEPAPTYTPAKDSQSAATSTGQTVQDDSVDSLEKQLQELKM